MISVVIPTLNAEAGLAATLSALVPAAVDGLVREVIIADGGSTDHTLEIADGAGAEIMRCDSGRGSQLRAGAARARFPWLMFLHPDIELEVGWEREASQHIDRIAAGHRPDTAAVFRFAVDDEGLAPRTFERLVSLRSSLLKLPYGDQGLLISRVLYDRVGGYAPLPMMEDVDLVRRLGRSRVAALRARALSSPRRFRRDGYMKRLVRNHVCLSLYLMKVPVTRIARLYGGQPRVAARQTVAGGSIS